MKKIQKIIGISFFSLIALTFFMLFVNDLTGIGDIIDAFQEFGQLWGIILTWFLEIGLCVAILVKSIMTIIGIVQDKEKDAKVLVKKNCFLLFLYFAISVVGGIFTLINLAQLGANSGLARPIVLIVFQALGAVAAFLVTLNWEKDSMYKILGGAAYAILFVALILTASNGVRGFLVAYIVFMFFVNILGVFHVLTYDVNFDKFFKIQEAPAAVEEKKEEKVEEKEEKKEENSDAE